MGVSGYSTRQEAAALEHYGLGWQPEVVIVGYVLNDPETSAADSPPLSDHFRGVVWWRYFNLLRAVARAKNNWDIHTLGAGNYNRFLHAPSQPRWQGVEQAFQRMRRLTQPQDIPVLVVIFPQIPKAWEAYTLDDIHRQVAEAAERAGLITLDLLPAYRQYAPSLMRLSPEDGHPTLLGHRVAAEAIHRKLLADVFPLFATDGPD